MWISCFGLMDWTDVTLLNRLKDEKGVDVFGKYAKISGVVAGIRDLDSYVNYKGGLVSALDKHEAKDELFAVYKLRQYWIVSQSCI